VGLSTTAIFSVFAGYFFGNFRYEASIIIKRLQSVVGFSVIPKCVTLNNLEWLFRVKFGFRASLSGFRSCEISKIIACKTNKGRQVLSAA